MSEQIISKQCSTCKEIKPISEFYKAKGNRDGFSNNCKVCHVKNVKKYSQTEKRRAYQKHYQKCYRQTEKSRKIQTDAQKRFYMCHPEQAKSHNAVINAIRDDQLPRPDSLSCHYCPAQAKQYHHHKGYEPEHWLDVVPVCIKCHNKIPKKQIISATVETRSRFDR